MEFSQRSTSGSWNQHGRRYELTSLLWGNLILLLWWFFVYALVCVIVYMFPLLVICPRLVYCAFQLPSECVVLPCATLLSILSCYSISAYADA